jgi:hypothetical protein
MLCRRFPTLTVCLLALFRTGHPYRLHRHSVIPVMSQSIKLFFSSTTVTEDGPRKKSRVNEVVVAAVVQTQQLDGTVEPEDKVATSAVPVSKDEVEPMVQPVLESTPDLQPGWALFDNLEPGWKASLSAEFNRPYFKSLLRFLESERRSHTIYPPVCDMFSAFNLCPLEQVKVLHKPTHCSTDIVATTAELSVCAALRWW